MNPILFTVIKILIMVGFLFNVAALLTWLDRRLGGAIQDRIGPNRAYLPIFGKKFRVAGLLHTAADGLKFFFKEDFMPPKADKVLFSIAPILVMVPVLTLVTVIPFGDVICADRLISHPSAGHWVWHVVDRVGMCTGKTEPMHLMIAPLNVGLLFIFALAGQGIVGAAIAGVSSDNKFSLMGALRAASQMVSYEVAIGLSVVGAMMIYGTSRLDEMVRWQDENCWGIFAQPLAFFLFFSASIAEQKRIPFDLPEAESELVSGYFTEYSGMKFGMFYFAEYMEVVITAMVVTTIFLGGWALPFIHRDGITIAFGDTLIFAQRLPHLLLVLIGVLGFFGKVLFLCWIQAVVRWSLPRFRYDQLMRIGWRGLLPLALGNILVTGVVILGLKDASPATAGVLRVLMDLSSLLVASLVTFGVGRVVFGLFSPTHYEKFVVTSAQKVADGRGGTIESPLRT